MKDYAVMSLDLHLFFARIMKEHSLFLEAGFQAKDTCFIKKAASFREQFEKILEEAVQMANGFVSASVLESGEIVTEFTRPAECKTELLTGIPINSRITEKEMCLTPAFRVSGNRQIYRNVSWLNQRALSLVEQLIAFKEEILENVSVCRLFTANYPLLIKHILREAKLYRTFLKELVMKGTISDQCIYDTEKFWNQIMMEHALFIRGLLDPSEEELIAAANGFAQDYKKLLCHARTQNCRTMDEMTQKALKETEKYRDFKAAGTKGITECKISSIILPLLADHVLREANHYLRILEQEDYKAGGRCGTM